MNKMKPLSKMTKKELTYWINWAEVEKQEYKDFIKKLKEELKKRK